MPDCQLTVLKPTGTECSVLILGVVTVTTSVTDCSHRDTIARRHLRTVKLCHGIACFTSCNQQQTSLLLTSDKINCIVNYLANAHFFVLFFVCLSVCTSCTSWCWLL